MILKEEYSKEEILNYIDEINTKWEEFTDAVSMLSIVVGEDNNKLAKYIDLDKRSIEEEKRELDDDIADVIEFYSDVVLDDEDIEYED